MSLANQTTTTAQLIAQFNQAQLIYVVLIVAGFASAFVVGILWFVKNLLRTKSGKKIDSTKASHRQLVLAATPGHRATLLKVNQFLPGTLETAKFENRVKSKRKTFYEPEKTEISLLASDLVANTDLNDEEKEQSLALTQQCLTNMLRLNTEKVFLEDGVPLTLALEDKVITTGVKGIGALAYYEKLCRIKQIKDKIESLKTSPTFQEVGTYLESLLSQVSLINIDTLRNYFDSDWDQSDDEAQKDYYFMMGFRKGKKGEKGLEKWIIFGGIGIGIAGVVGGAVLAWLGK